MNKFILTVCILLIPFYVITHLDSVTIETYLGFILTLCTVMSIRLFYIDTRNQK